MFPKLLELKLQVSIFVPGFWNKIIAETIAYFWNVLHYQLTNIIPNKYLAIMSYISDFSAGIHHIFEQIKGIDIAELSTGIQQNVRNTKNFSMNIKNHQSIRVVDRILSTCVNHRKGIHPRIFCRRWFGLEDLDVNGRPRYTEEMILAIESEHGYREKCINLIARVLKIKPNTIHRWGKGVEFDKIPSDRREQYEMYLGYIDSLRVIILNLAGFNEDLLRKLLRRLESK